MCGRIKDMANPTISDRVFYFDADGTSNGEVDVVDHTLLRTSMVQRAQLLNFSSNNPGLPSILEEYNRIRLQYPRRHTASITDGSTTYLADAPGPLKIEAVDVVAGWTRARRIEFEFNHGLFVNKFIDITVPATGSTAIINITDTGAQSTLTALGNGIVNYHLFLRRTTDNQVVAYGITRYASNELTVSGTVNFNNFAEAAFIARAITGVEDGEFVGIATAAGAVINVNSSTITSGNPVPENTFVANAENQLYALNASISVYSVTDNVSYLVQPLYFLEDAVGVMNTQLQAKYGDSAPTLSVVNNTMVSSKGTLVTNTDNRSAGMIVVPPYYYDNAFPVLGGALASEMNRFFLPTPSASEAWSNHITVNGNNITLCPGKYSNIEGLARHISVRLTNTYVVKVVRTTGTTTYSGGTAGTETTRLAAELDLRPVFRVQGERVEGSQAEPYRPRVYQVRIEGPNNHEIGFMTTSPHLCRVLGVEQAGYSLNTGEMAGSVQYDQETRGFCTVSLSQAPKRFTVNLQNNTFQLNVNNFGIVSGIRQINVNTDQATASNFAVGLSEGELVNLRTATGGNNVFRAVVVRRTVNDPVTEFSFGLWLCSNNADLVFTGTAGGTFPDGSSAVALSITRLNGNRVKWDVSGYPLPRLMSPAPVIGLDNTTIIRGSTQLPRPYNAFVPAYYLRLVTEADGTEPQQNPTPQTMLDGKRNSLLPYGYRMGGRDWVGGPINVPMVLTVPVRVAHLKVRVTFPDNTPVDLSGQTFVGAVSVSGQDRVAYFDAQHKKYQL